MSRRKRLEHTVGAAVAAWEFVALATRILPPISALLRRYPKLGSAAVGWLAWHLFVDVG